MSAKHRLTPGSAGLYGKHPAFGDFISTGLDAVWQGFADWLQASLGAWRDADPDDWQLRFDAAPMLAFWIGPQVLGSNQPMRGIMGPSRDRSGRRFPLALAQAGGAPPVLDPAQDFHVAAAQALTAILAVPQLDPRAAVQALHLPVSGQDGAPDWPAFWAGNPALGPQDLLSQLVAVDHAHATAARSYWWFGTKADLAASHGPSGVLCCQGWPDPVELGWLLAGGNLREDAT